MLRGVCILGDIRERGFIRIYGVILVNLGEVMCECDC